MHDLNNPQQRARWKAHDADISCLYCSPFSVSMLSGAANGAACMWDLQKRPNKPTRTWLHPAQVSGLQMLSQVSLVRAYLTHLMISNIMSR